MPSLTLLAADPHLTPVRARPALAFSGREAGAMHQRRARRTRLALPLWHRGGAQATAEPAASRSERATEAVTTADTTARAPRRFSLRRRGTSSPSRQRSFFGWRTAAAAVVVLIVTGLGVLRVWPPFAVVMSGSMAPTINTGDMVVLQRLHAPARVGEVVAVPVPDDARSRYGYPPVVIHRVLRITDRQIRTKGDARPAADPFTVPRTAVHARVVADIPAGGRILSFFHSGPGLVWLLFGAVLFFGLPLLDRLRDARGLEAEADADLREQLAAVSARLAHLQAEQEHSRRTAHEALSQLDHLTRLVTEALAQHPAAAGDRLRRPESSPRDDAHVTEQATEAAAAAAQTGTSPGPEPDADACASPGLASVLDPAPTAGAEMSPATPGTAEGQPGSTVQPSIAAQAGSTPGTISGAESADPIAPAEPVREAPESLPGAQAASTPVPADEPALDPGLPPAAQPVMVARPEISDAADLGLRPVSASVLVPVDEMLARPVGDVGRVLAPIGLGRVGATFARWDAPPPASAANAGGWAAPPAPARSSRFQRPARLIAASLAQPSPAA